MDCTVTFRALDKSIKVSRGMDLLTAAIKCGIVLNASCGGEGLCGKCRVIVEKGKVKAEVSRLISDDERKRGFVLACQTLVEGDVEVLIPKETLGVHGKVAHEAEEFTKGVILKREEGLSISPLAKKVYIELTSPTADDNVSDLERIYRELKSIFKDVNISTRLANVKHLSELMRDSNFKITVALGYKEGGLEMLAIEPGNAASDNYGFAFDIGTTTVVGQLIDLNTKNIIGTRIAFNKQANFGSDVISRIIYAQEPGGLERLHDAILENMNEIIEDLAGAGRVNLADVYTVMCAGNTTMTHLLLKIDPANIRRAPYIPVTNVYPSINSSEIELETNPKAIVSFMPGVASYVGGDIVSGVLASGISENGETSLLIDIGTNGEIVLGNNEWMIGAAASAGPAFEGSGLSCGMKAVRGAIQKVLIKDDLSVQAVTIGGEKPRGICGSGYIDLLCQLLKRGIIEKNGKINRTLKSERVRRGETNYEFVVAHKGETSTGRDIVIQEDDIENLKRSKGAIYSAVISLLNKVGQDISDVKTIYIAGGFGNYLNIENSIYIGLLPDIGRDIYQFIGNSSLAGARMALLSYGAFLKAHDIYKKITYVDLGSEPNYMDEYIASLFFPHTDMGRFPSVR